MINYDVLQGDDEGDADETKGFTFIYVSHFFSTFGDRMWQFAIPILFIEIWPKTILPCSIFMFGNNIAQFLLLPYVGGWSDRRSRSYVIKTCIIGQNLSIMLCSFVLFLLVHLSTDQPTGIEWNTKTVITFCAVTLSSIMGELLGRCSTNALEKDWIVVMCHGDKEQLATTNSQMRRIDLCSKILAPMTFALILQTFDDYAYQTRLYVAVAIIFLWNSLSLPIEYTTISIAYNRFALQLDAREEHDQFRRRSPLSDSLHGWRRYIKHPVFFASLSYCMLYMTVLDNGILMIAYLNYRKIPKLLLGLTRGTGAVFGLIGTIVYPTLLRKLGSLSKASSLSLILFAISITPIAGLFLLEGWRGERLELWGGDVTPYVMMVAVAISRTWLWMFDLGESQILQETIDESERGVLNSVENSMCQVCNRLVVMHLMCQ